MNPERMASLVARWVRFYTRDLPAPIAERRIDEIDADLHDHIAHDRAAGTSERRIALAVASRMVRGLAADAAWHRRQPKAAARRPLHRSAVRVAVGVAVVLAIPLVGMLLSDGVAWSVADFVAAGVLLATIGVVLELAVRKAGNLLLALVVGGLGVTAAVLGELDDAPGLVLLGLLLIVSACALGVRTARRA